MSKAIKRILGIMLSIVILASCAAGCAGKTATDTAATAATVSQSTETAQDGTAPVSALSAGSRTYKFDESAMNEAFTVPWELELHPDGTYQLTEKNSFMGTIIYTGSYTEKDGVVTTGPLQGGSKPQAPWFNADLSCEWKLGDGNCTPANYTSSGTAAAGNAAGGTAGGAAGSVSSGKTPTYDSVAYASVSKSETMDIYLPQGQGPFPVIIAVHGGAFMMGDSKMPVIQPIFSAVDKGYAVVSINYRLSSEANAPGAVADAKAAVRFLRANADKYKLDPKHIAIWGESAGAYIAIMVALTPTVTDLNGDVKDNLKHSSEVQALVDFYGPNKFYTMDEEFKSLGKTSTTGTDTSPESKYLGQNVMKDKAATDKTDPTTYLSQLPKAFGLMVWIQHGTGDTKVPYTQSKNLAEKLTTILGKDKVQFSLIDGAEHEDAAFYKDDNMAKIFDFLSGVL